MQKADWKCFADIFRQIHVLKAKELPDLSRFKSFISFRKQLELGSNAKYMKYFLKVKSCTVYLSATVRRNSLQKSTEL